MVTLAEIKKQQQIDFDYQNLDIKEALQQRNSEIIDIKHVCAQGQVSYDNNFYILCYHLSYQITLPSNRSLQAVTLDQTDRVEEIFSENNTFSSDADSVMDFVITLESDSIDIKESIIDNILLAIPMRILTKEEEQADQLPSGENWELLTQEQYQKRQQDKAQAKNPFQQLEGWLDEE